MRKLKPTERLQTKDSLISFYDEVTIQELQEAFDRFIEEYDIHPETAVLTMISDMGGDSSFGFMGIRDETESEKRRRLDVERSQRVRAGERRKAKLEQERKEYERLKKKFDG